jgi:type VI secretion system protein ImpL
MNRPLSIWVPAASTALTFGVLGLTIPSALGVQGGAQRWLITGVLWFLGLVASGLVFVWRSAKAKAAPPTEKSTDEIDVTIAAARNRLAAARGKAAARFGQLPLILIAGPAGSTKTTLITRSGMEPELLAGEVVRGDAVIPTSAINVWFAQGNLVFEAGGGVAADQNRWKKLIRHIQPSRAGAVLSKGAQAPRVAVVTLSCEEFLKPGASESVGALAQGLRARLAEVSQQLGIRLPVYVVFTKADRLPHFDDFVRSFTRDEARDVLGATLPIAPAGNTGQYAERESQRLAFAFYEMFRGLASRRLDVLPRETQDAVKAGAYEFPREFRKVTELATQFLLDLCRPSQLGVSPFLRGFYFTGVRAIYVHDAAAAAPALQQRGSAGAPDATGIFDPRMLQPAQAAQPATPGARKVPEWVFLDRLFRDLILKDRVAQDVTAGGTKVTLGRRILLGAAMAALLIFCVGMTFSVVSNARLLGRTRAALVDAQAIATTTSVPDLDALQRLERLREQAAVFNRNEREGPVMRRRWLLYPGDRVQPDVRAAYFQKFDDVLWRQTKANLTQSLATLPATPAPNSDYERTYEALKAYLVTTQYPDSAQRDFLAPALLKHSAVSPVTDSTQRALAMRQFAFFANELTQEEKPLVGEADVALVDRTRNYLKAFAGDDQLYSYLLSFAGEGLTQVSFAEGPVRSGTVVPAAFTAPAWQKAQAALADVERLFNREPWVVGESGIRREDRVRLEATLRERYTTEYVDHWIRYLNSGSVSLGNRQQAANTLGLLAGPASPILRIIAQASNNTAVDSVRVDNVFKPAHSMVAPKSTATAENANKYLSALINVQGPLNVVAATPEDAAAVAQLNTAIGQARAVVNSITLAFDQQGKAREVGAAIGKLLMEPLNHSATIVAGIGPGILNQKGQEFCSGIQQALRGKYPFSRGGADATIEDLGVLAPNVITNFYQESLAAHLSRTPTGFQIRGGSTRINTGFRDYLNYLDDVSTMLYSGGNNTPHMEFNLRITVPSTVTEVTANILGQVLRATPTLPVSRNVTWAAASNPVQIRATLNNREQVVYVDEPSGLWSVFRMMYGADAQRQGPTGYIAVLKQPGKPDITLHATFEASKPHPVFSPDWLGRVNRCVSQIAL